MSNVIAVGQKYWNEGRGYVQEHWRAIAALVITVVSLYAVWGKDALLASAAAGALACCFRIPVITYLEMHIGGISLTVGILAIPHVPAPFNYMVAAVIAVAFLSYERDASKARVGIQEVTKSNENQIGQLQEMRQDFSSVSQNLQQTVDQSEVNSKAIAEAQTVANQIKAQAEKEATEMRQLTQQLNDRLKQENNELERRNQALSSTISTQESQLRKLREKAKDFETGVTRDVHNKISHLGVNENLLTDQISQLERLLESQQREGGKV